MINEFLLIFGLIIVVFHYSTKLVDKQKLSKKKSKPSKKLTKSKSALSTSSSKSYRSSKKSKSNSSKSSKNSKKKSSRKKKQSKSIEKQKKAVEKINKNDLIIINLYEHLSILPSKFIKIKANGTFTFTITFSPKDRLDYFTEKVFNYYY